MGSGGRRWNDNEPGAFSTPACKVLPGIVYVSDMQWKHASAGADNTVHRDNNYAGAEIVIAGKSYPKGIWTHAFNNATPADLVLDIEGKHLQSFVSDAGVEDSAGAGSVQFQVIVDGQLRAESPVMHSGASHAFNLDIAGAKEVILRVMNGGDGFACDHAAWGFAHFIQENAEDPLKYNQASPIA